MQPNCRLSRAVSLQFSQPERVMKIFVSSSCDSLYFSKKSFSLKEFGQTWFTIIHGFSRVVTPYPSSQTSFHILYSVKKSNPHVSVVRVASAVYPVLAKIHSLHHFSLLGLGRCLKTGCRGVSSRRRSRAAMLFLRASASFFLSIVPPFQRKRHTLSSMSHTI